MRYVDGLLIDYQSKHQWCYELKCGMLFDVIRPIRPKLWDKCCEMCDLFPWQSHKGIKWDEFSAIKAWNYVNNYLNY